MADKKKVVRRTAEERKAALEQEIAELEAKVVERARKALVAKTERLAKVVALRDKCDEEADTLLGEIRVLEQLIGTGPYAENDENDEQAEEVAQPTLSAAG